MKVVCSGAEELVVVGGSLGRNFNNGRQAFTSLNVSFGIFSFLKILLIKGF
jgi:hypothetical protein